MGKYLAIGLGGVVVGWLLCDNVLIEQRYELYYKISVRDEKLGELAGRVL